MKYNISGGQLIVMWIFGLILMLADFIATMIAMEAENSSSLLAILLLVMIPFALIFYTVGWYVKRKK